MSAIEAMEEIVTRITAALASGDAEALAALYEPDAAIVHPIAGRLKGSDRPRSVSPSRQPSKTSGAK